MQRCALPLFLVLSGAPSLTALSTAYEGCDCGRLTRLALLAPALGIFGATTQLVLLLPMLRMSLLLLLLLQRLLLLEEMCRPGFGLW